MKALKFFISFSFFSFNSFSCKNEILSSKINFQAIFTDKTTNKPVQGVFVSVSGFSSSYAPKPLGGDTRYDNLSNSISNLDGIAIAKFKPLRKATRYEINYSSDLYFTPTSKDLNISEIGIGNLVTVKYNIEPKAKLKLNYKNAKPYDDNDYLKTFFSGGSIGFHIPKSTTGKNVDGSETFEVGGNKKLVFDIRVTRNGKETRYEESTFIKPFELNEYTINY